MEQLADVVLGLVDRSVVRSSSAIGVAAMALGADSRPCVGDSHTTQPRPDWI